MLSTLPRRLARQPGAMLGSIAANRFLLGQLVRRNIATQYRTSVGGLLWTLAKPLSLLVVYALVFGGVFKSRLVADGREFDAVVFALMLFFGLTLYGLAAEMLAKATTIVASHPNYVKKVVFPLDILVLGEFGSACLHGAVGLVIFLVGLIATGNTSAHALWLVAIVPPFVLSILGLSWLLAALGVYVRDLAQSMPVVTTAMLFLSPVFYPIEQMPELVRPLLWINPLTVPVELGRDALLLARAPGAATLAAYWGAALLVLQLGWSFFNHTRRGFADVL